MDQIALAIAAVGCIAASCYLWVKTKGANGEGWAIIAVLLLISLKACSP